MARNLCEESLSATSPCALHRTETRTLVLSARYRSYHDIPAHSTDPLLVMYTISIERQPLAHERRHRRHSERSTIRAVRPAPLNTAPRPLGSATFRTECEVGRRVASQDGRTQRLTSRDGERSTRRGLSQSRWCWVMSLALGGVVSVLVVSIASPCNTRAVRSTRGVTIVWLIQ